MRLASFLCNAVQFICYLEVCYQQHLQDIVKTSYLRIQYLIFSWFVSLSSEFGPKDTFQKVDIGFAAVAPSRKEELEKMKEYIKARKNDPEFLKQVKDRKGEFNLFFFFIW